ncbi:MAG: GntR family transcriptional regulator [Steroidobacteraceae bacterium]
MSIERERQALFEVATGDHLDSMNQAVRLACAFEHELLQSNDMAAGAPVHAESLSERFGVSRSVRNEAIRILQSREVIRAKPGRNGGLLALGPSSDHLLKVVSQYSIYRRMSAAVIAESQEVVDFVRSTLPAGHPARTIVGLMADVAEGLSAWAQVESSRSEAMGCRPRAELIAQQLGIRILRSETQPDRLQGLRLGHEDELCEQFRACRAVVRQAIRILESQSLVECRRGRGHGLFLASPKPGPTTRLIALWLLDNKLSLRHILDFERPLRTAVAVLAMRKMQRGSDQPVLELQRRSEAAGNATLLDVIEIEKNISWLSSNALLDLFLRTITVYKICRGHYRQMDPRGLESYLGINARVLQALIRRNETAIQKNCDEKNDCLSELDLRVAPPG